MNLSIEDAIALALAIHGVALAVVNITPTPKDDEAMRRFYKVLELFAGIGPMAKR